MVVNKYFFDILMGAHIEYDYRGRAFDQPAKAKEYAELMALDIAVSSNEQNCRGQIQVRDIAGNQLFSAAVRPELLAA